MVFATLFPLGVVQLYHSVSSGYFDARTLQFIAGGANPVLEWLRLPVDVLFIVGGVPPILYLWWLSIRYMVPAVKPTEEEREILFTEVVGRTGHD
jgi:nitric oxide reductase subunit B